MENEYIPTKDSEITDPDKWKSPATRLTSVQLRIDLWKLAKINFISFNEALEFGIRFMIAEKQGFDHPSNSLNEKILRLAEKLNAKSMECEALRQQLKEENLDEIFREGKLNGE